MLTIQLDELLELRHQAQGLGLISSKRMQTPLSGLYASVFRGQGMEFDEIREYRHGDEIRHIDWRVTARLRKPYLKIYREERERNVILCIDTSAYMQFGTRHTFKSVQAARVAALLGWSAHEHRDRVGGLLFGQTAPRFFRPNRSQRSFWQLLQQLTVVSEPADNSNALADAISLLNHHIIGHTLLFIVADFSQFSIEILRKTFTLLHQRHEIVLIAIDDPADYHLPAMGLIRFTAPDGKQITINTDNVQGRQTYQHYWLQHRQQLEDLTKRLAIDLLHISTQDDVYQSLLTGLRQRAHQQQMHR